MLLLLPPPSPSHLEMGASLSSSLLHLLPLPLPSLRLHSDTSPPLQLCTSLSPGPGRQEERCSDCLLYQPCLPSHYSLPPAPTPLLNCPSCPCSLPSACSLAAHSRLHSRLPPHTCPECGQVFYTWAALTTHLSYSCPHHSRSTVYLCPSCPPASAHCSGKRQEVVQHMASQHTRRYFRCAQCSKAFRTVEAVRQHGRQGHQLSTSELGQPELLYRVRGKGGSSSFFQSQEALLEYLGRVAIGERSVFLCSFCHSLFWTGEELVGHQEEHKHREAMEEVEEKKAESRTGHPLKLQSPELATPKKWPELW